MPLVKECFGSLPDALFDRFEDFIWVMVNPSANMSTRRAQGLGGVVRSDIPSMGVELAKLDLMLSDWVTEAIEDQKS